MSFPLGDGIHITPDAVSLITGQRKLAPSSVKAVADHALSQYFEATHGSVVHSRNDLKIFQPRMEPTSPPRKWNTNTRFIGGETQYGFGCFGLCTVVQEQGRPVRVISDAGSSAMLFWAISSLPAAVNACPERISMLLSLC